MIQKEFAERVLQVIRKDDNVIGLAAAGSWISGELDEYSDLDLILVTQNKIAPDRNLMENYAAGFGNLLSSFTGEHVGEPRVLICMYDNPLLHVDIKFITLDELTQRVEDPVILYERDKQLSTIIKNTESKWPHPDYQWVEDRFWTWVHYMAGKVARGEYFEVLDALGFIRLNVLAPFQQIKNNLQPRGLRKLEFRLPADDLQDLKATIATHEIASLLKAIDNSIVLYEELRTTLFPATVQLRKDIKRKSLEYWNEVKNRLG